MVHQGLDTIAHRGVIGEAGRLRTAVGRHVRVAEGPAAEDMHVADEGIRMDATLDGIAGVKLLREGGRIIAASASQICDGASGVLVVNERGLKALGVKPLARIHHMTVIGGDPVIMLEAPLPATHRALKKADMAIDDIELFEVNEAFASGGARAVAEGAARAGRIRPLPSTATPPV